MDGTTQSPKAIATTELLRFCRYMAVGVLNTLVTLAVIFLCKSILGINPWVSNCIGYVAGLVNSFVWNRHWVFRSTEGSVTAQAVRFAIGFGLCYVVQLGATWLLTTHLFSEEMLVEIGPMTLSGYGIATLLGMVVYTALNFLYNKVVTFK